MKWITVLFLLTIAFLCTCNAEQFCIEDNNLKPVPDNAVQAILASENNEDWKRCKFIGKSVDLIGNGKSKALVITTANGCGCGNALCTIWVLQPKGDSYDVLLTDGGYCMKVGKSKGKNLSDITFEASSVGWSQKSLWKFNGKRYVKVKFKID